MNLESLQTDEETHVNSNNKYTETRTETENHIQLSKENDIFYKWHSNNSYTGCFMHCILKIAKC